MRDARPFVFLALGWALGGCHSCKRTPPQDVEVVPEKPLVDAGPEVSDAGAKPSASQEAPSAKTVPAVACTTGAWPRWLDEPVAQFSCSDLVTKAASSYVDASGAKVSPLELTVSPGTELTVGLGVKNAKGLAYASAIVRYQLEGAPTAVKIDAAAQKLKFKVDAAAGSTFLFEVAALVKLTEGEHCVKQPIVVNVVDDDDTRAHQIANKVRMNAFFRTLDCQWAHQGPDLAENASNDAADEKSLRDSLACGRPLVNVVMRDLNGDGLKDAIVTFREHTPTTPPVPPARWETGPGVQIHLRKGDDFVFAGEAPGELIEADDGTPVILDTNHVEHSLCPPRPYKSTGFPACDVTHVEVRKLVGARIEWVGEHDGAEVPDAFDGSECPKSNLTVEKDGKGRLIGFLDGSHHIPWNEKTPAP